MCPYQPTIFTAEPSKTINVEPNYQEIEKSLGDSEQPAQLGVSWVLLDGQKSTCASGQYKEMLSFPTASTVKIALSLCVLSQIYSDNPSLTLDQMCLIENDEFSPGPPFNPLDKYFFDPKTVQQKASIEQLLTYMHLHSDNTATDKLFSLVGGPGKVTEFITQLGLTEFNASRTSKQMLCEYYDCHGDKNIKDELDFLYEFIVQGAYMMRPTEKTMFTDGKDSCAPHSMLSLLTLLMIPEHFKQWPWLIPAANFIRAKMLLCETGKDMIRRGAATTDIPVIAIGDKTGSLGGILNDAAFIRFEDGRTLLLSISSCFSTIENKEQREQIIAQLAAAIINQANQTLQMKIEEVISARFCCIS